MPPPSHPATPPNRSTAVPARDFYARQAVVLHARDAEDRRRIMLAVAVMCTGVLVAGLALWQARNARTVYVPVPSEPASPPAFVTTAPAAYAAPFAESTSYRAPVAGNTFDDMPPVPARHTAAPAMPQTWTPPPAFAASTPVDHAERDRRVEELKSHIENLDEEVRCIREHPTDPRYYWHYYSSVYRGVDQARRDAYLKELDKERNDLRRQKWALEGR